MVEEKESTEVLEFFRTKLGIELDEQEVEVLKSEAKRGILNCCRQWGKSTVTARAVHRAHTQKDRLVLVASPSKRQSAQFLRKGVSASTLAILHPACKQEGSCPPPTTIYDFFGGRDCRVQDEIRMAFREMLTQVD